MRNTRKRDRLRRLPETEAVGGWTPEATALVRASPLAEEADYAAKRVSDTTNTYGSDAAADTAAPTELP